MIDDLSKTLRTILSSDKVKQEFPMLGAAEIEFVRPTNDYKPKSPRTVCLFLYDIRENRELRSNEPLRVTRNGQPQVERPPLRVDCCYLITAWLTEAMVADDKKKVDDETARDPILQEHLLLSEVLQVLARYPTIPTELLQGKLSQQPLALPMITAQAEGLKNISEFWTAIGSNLRPSLSVKATIAMQVSAAEPEAKPVTQRILVPDKPARLEVAGQVTGQVDGETKALADARVALVELGLSTTTDSNGRYVFSGIPIGKYQLRINWSTGGKLKRKNLEINVPAAAGAYDVELKG
jgi:hypothetical protein